jgi:hypothetical protein
MSPEQAKAKKLTAVHIYAPGVMYECLVGRPPWPKTP